MKAIKSIFQSKLFATFIVLISVCAILAKPVTAAFIEDAGVGGGSANQNWQKFSASVNDDNYDNTDLSGHIVLNVWNSVTSIFGGWPDANGNISLVSIDRSVIGGLAKATNLTYQVPVSSGQYFAHVLHQFNSVTPAYAQSGEGWQFLEPVLIVWTIVRNLVYSFFIVIFVAIGFMIMFRQKIDPQTTASIQAALPKIIISLILTTFSYAIAGLIIDVAFLLNGIIDSVLFKSGGPILVNINKYPSLSPITSVNVDQVISKFWAGLTAGGVIDWLGAGLAGIFTLVIVVSAFKLFFGLLSKYVTLVLSTVISPFIFLWGALPGQGESKTWFKTMISSALSFPVTYLLLNLALYFMTLGWSTQGIKPFALDFFPPTKGPAGALPYESRLVGLGVFLAACKAPEIIDSLLKAEKPLGGIGGMPEVQGVLRKIPVIGGLMG